jgi:hypothetical protein
LRGHPSASGIIIIFLLRRRIVLILRWVSVPSTAPIHILVSAIVLLRVSVIVVIIVSVSILRVLVILLWRILLRWRLIIALRRARSLGGSPIVGALWRLVITLVVGHVGV